MTHFRLPLTLQFAPGESLRWTQRRGVKLEVLSGRIWLTHRGDPHDHFLHAGESCTLRRETASLIGADGPVSVRIEAAGSPLCGDMVVAVKAAIGRRIKGSATVATHSAGGIIFR